MEKIYSRDGLLSGAALSNMLGMPVYRFRALLRLGHIAAPTHPHPLRPSSRRYYTAAEAGRIKEVFCPSGAESSSFHWSNVG